MVDYTRGTEDEQRPAPLAAETEERGPQVPSPDPEDPSRQREPPSPEEDEPPETTRHPSPGVKHEPEPDADNLIPAEDEPGTF